MAATPGLLFVLLLLPLLLLPLLGFFLPPPKCKPAGAFYWVVLGLFLSMLILLGVGFAVGAVRDYVRYGRLLWWHAVIPLASLGVVFTLLANTFWVLGQWRRLPVDLGEERREALRRLSRRLWMPLCALGALVIVLPSGYSLVRTSIPSFVNVKTGPMSVTLLPIGVPLELVGIQRLPDGACRIELVFHIPGGPYEQGELKFYSPRLRAMGTREWPCEFESQTEWRGAIPAEVSLMLRVSPPADLRKGNLDIDYHYSARSALKNTSGFSVSGLSIDLPAPAPPVQPGNTPPS